MKAVLGGKSRLHDEGPRGRVNMLLLLLLLLSA
jgi:hypothetical protein